MSAWILAINAAPDHGAANIRSYNSEPSKDAQALPLPLHHGGTQQYDAIEVLIN